MHYFSISRHLESHVCDFPLDFGCGFVGIVLIWMADAEGESMNVNNWIPRNGNYSIGKELSVEFTGELCPNIVYYCWYFHNYWSVASVLTKRLLHSGVESFRIKFIFERSICMYMLLSVWQYSLMLSIQCAPCAVVSRLTVSSST